MTPELKPLNCPFCGAWATKLDEAWMIHPATTSCFLSRHAFTIKQWNTRHNPAESALNAAREAIEKAPHELRCDCRLDANGKLHDCNCWKSSALTQLNE